MAIGPAATPLPVRDLAAALERRLARLTQLLRAEANRSGLSITALSTLRRLEDDGPSRVTDLAGAEVVAQPTMTTLVGRLEARALVRRDADPDDRRAVRVAITDAGREQLAAVRAERARLLAARLDGLGDEALAALAGAIPALDQLLDPDAA